MANVILKSTKFARLLNGWLSFSSLKSYYFNRQYISGSLQQTRQKKFYTTAAFKVETNEDIAIKNDSIASNNSKKQFSAIDDAVTEIDIAVRKTGRVLTKHVNEAFSLISAKDATSSEHGLYLLRSCKFCIDEPSSKRLELVSKIWNKYQKLGVELDVRHYNALLDVQISNGLQFNPTEILVTMENANIDPNKRTYLLVMKKYCQDGDIVGASEVLEYMKTKGLTADEKVFNYLIEGHVKANDLTGAKDLIEVMRSSNLEPNAETYSILACAYASNGEKDEMISCLKKCGSDAGPYLKVIEVLSTSGHHQHIDEVLSLIPNKALDRQQLVNAAVELIHKDQLDVAYKLSFEACSSGYNEPLIIFLKQLMRTQKPVDQVLNFCDKISTENTDSVGNIYVIATRIVSDMGSVDYAIPFFKKMVDKGGYLRPGSFLPLLSSLKGENSKDVWKVLKIMSEFGVPANENTIYLETIYPTLGMPQPEDVLQNVQKSGQILDTAANALFYYYCNLGEIDLANRLTQSFPVGLGGRFSIEAFLENAANLNKENLNSYLKLLRYIFMEIDNSRAQNVIKGKLLAQLIERRQDIVETLLKKYEDLKFDQGVLRVCEEEILDKIPFKHAIVKKLRSISLERQSAFSTENISIEEENKYINHLKEQNLSCQSFLTKRILYHIRTKNADRVFELLDGFDKMKLIYSPLMFVNLISLYCGTGDVAKAKEMFDRLSAEVPDFKLDDAKVLEYATLLIKYERFDESYEVLKNFLKEPHYISSRDFLLKNVRNLNITLGRVEDIEFVKKVQNLVFSLSKEVGSKKLFLEPVIFYHLQRNNLEAAVEEFRNVVITHRIPAGLSHILKKCVIRDDKKTLQKVVDLGISCSRKSYVLLELAVVFLGHYVPHKAERIIDSIGTEMDPRDLEEMCLKLSNQNMLNELEQLIYITKSLTHVDRESLYMQALRACAYKNDLERAKTLFKNLKKEIEEPKPEIINFVEELFNKKYQALPVTSSTILKNTAESLKATEPFIEHLKTGNAEAALNALNLLKKGYIRTLPLQTLTELIDLCLQGNCTNRLSQNVQAMSYIIDNVKDVLLPLVRKYSDAGDVEKFIAISSFIPDFSLINIGYNTYFCKAFLNSGQHDRLLSELEQHVGKKNKLYSSFAFEEMLKLPEYENKLFNLAVKYADESYFMPMTVMWAHYFSKGDYERAEEVFRKYNIQIERTNLVIREIKENEDIPLALKYVDFVKSTSARQRVKERAFGFALELLVMKEKYDEAVALVVEAEKLNLLLHNYYLKSLITLKDALERKNQPVPFTLPLDTGSGSG